MASVDDEDERRVLPETFLSLFSHVRKPMSAITALPRTRRRSPPTGIERGALVDGEREGSKAKGESRENDSSSLFAPPLPSLEANNDNDGPRPFPYGN